MKKLAEFLIKNDLALKGYDDDGVPCFVVSLDNDDIYYISFKADDVSIEDFIQLYLEPCLDPLYKVAND